MKFNPTAVIFWAFSACLGFLFSGSLLGTVIGLTCALGFSLLLDLIL